MFTKGIAPRLGDSLRSLAESQLQTQASRSGALDVGALGVVSACAAIAAIIVGVRSADDLWIAALVLLGVEGCRGKPKKQTYKRNSKRTSVARKA